MGLQIEKIIRIGKITKDTSDMTIRIIFGKNEEVNTITATHCVPCTERAIFMIMVLETFNERRARSSMRLIPRKERPGRQIHHERNPCGILLFMANLTRNTKAQLNYIPLDTNMRKDTPADGNLKRIMTDCHLQHYVLLTITQTLYLL